MKILFTDKEPDMALTDINNILSGRKLGKIVSLEQTNDGLTVVITKMGTSKLFFTQEDTEGGFSLSLSKEKIAFSHKAFKSEVTEKFIDVVKQAGGDVTI